MRYISISILFILLSFSFSEKKLSGFSEKIIPLEPDSLVSITLSVAGDIMCHSVQYNYARVKADSFNFNPVFSQIKKYLDQSDFVFGNLETVTAGRQKGYSGYPFFNSPDEFIAAIKNAGFDLLSTANNHALDRGEPGVRRTIEELKLHHLDYNGTFLSQSDRDSIRIFDIKGIKVAFLAYTYGTNGNPIPKGKEYLINIIDTIKIRNDIKLARNDGSDIVLVHFHFGDEYQREPTEYQKEIVDQTIKAGADIIIGGHPHVLQPIKSYRTLDSKMDSGFVAYSMGNFISNQRWRYSDGGAILSFKLTKNFSTDSIKINQINYLPIWVFKGETGDGKQYIILPSEAAFTDSNFTFLTPIDRKLAAQSFHDTKQILTKYSKKPRLEEINGNFFFGTEHQSFH
jgi:poly-gamma-glutamate synthesis protein (capsule biosynthesis protein)